MSASARLRRTYFDCRFGQLHVHQAIPPGGGFDEATALVCIPGVAGLGAFFQPLLAPLGADRSIYAPDLPGYGGSDGAVSGAPDCALAIVDLLDSLRQRRVDVLAHGLGFETAMHLVALRPGKLVRRLVFSSPPPQALAQARAQGLHVAEVSLAGAVEAAVPAALSQAQLDELKDLFGPDPSEHKK